MRMPDTLPAAAVDAARLATAMRAVGIFGGAERPLAEIVAGAADEAQAVRAYIQRERPHLLKAYDLETLVGIVLATRAASIEAPASLEAYRSA